MCFGKLHSLASVTKMLQVLPKCITESSATKTGEICPSTTAPSRQSCSRCHVPGDLAARWPASPCAMTTIACMFNKPQHSSAGRPFVSVLGGAGHQHPAGSVVGLRGVPGWRSRAPGPPHPRPPVPALGCSMEPGLEQGGCCLRCLLGAGNWLPGHASSQHRPSAPRSHRFELLSVASPDFRWSRR